MNEILKYFPHLSEEQGRQFEQLGTLYREWNEKINVISRKDIEHLYLHHVLHSLSIAKALNFKKGTRILDLGTGGGFPGIPLAIMFPECQFTLIDSILTRFVRCATMLEITLIKFRYNRGSTLKRFSRSSGIRRNT